MVILTIPESGRMYEFEVINCRFGFGKGAGKVDDGFRTREVVLRMDFWFFRIWKRGKNHGAFWRWGVFWGAHVFARFQTISHTLKEEST